MNNDLISRSALKKAIDEIHQKDLKVNPLWGSIGLNTLNRLIDNAPTVEPKQGEWITHITYFECSNCKHCYDYDYAEDIDPITDLNFNFCPNCGAYMKGGNK